jgi:hypothetical protein
MVVDVDVLVVGGSGTAVEGGAVVVAVLMVVGDEVGRVVGGRVDEGGVVELGGLGDGAPTFEDALEGAGVGLDVQGEGFGGVGGGEAGEAPGGFEPGAAGTQAPGAPAGQGAGDPEEPAGGEQGPGGEAVTEGEPAGVGALGAAAGA